METLYSRIGCASIGLVDGEIVVQPPAAFSASARPALHTTLPDVYVCEKARAKADLRRAAHTRLLHDQFPLARRFETTLLDLVSELADTLQDDERRPHPRGRKPSTRCEHPTGRLDLPKLIHRVACQGSPVRGIAPRCELAPQPRQAPWT